MRLLRMIGRDIRDAVKSVFRNFSLSMASIFCITITLILVAIAVISSYNVNNFSKLMQKEFTIVVFLDKDINDDKRTEVEYNIKENTNISEYKFQSKVDIANSMMQTSEVFKNIMQQWTEDENPLKDTYLIKVKDVQKISLTAKAIQKLDGVSVVKYGEGVIDNFLIAFRIIEKILIAVVILFVLVTAFLITNTIKLTIFSRKREIEIMRLVGASNFNITLPFAVEGLLLGLFGSIVPIIVVIYGYTALYGNFHLFISSPFIKLIQPQPFIFIISLILLSMGILVGMFGSFRAVRKYLKI